MPKTVAPLSASQVTRTRAKDRPLRLFDGGGLYLLVNPAPGGKLWRLKYRFEGRERLLSLGAFPAVSLADARTLRDEARKQIARGINPGEVRAALKREATGEAPETLRVVAQEWFEKFQPTWKPGQIKAVRGRLDRDLLPHLGDRPIAEIKAPELLAVLRRVESRGALESAHRVRIVAGQVFRYAVATGRAERDPSTDLRGALPPSKEKHFAAIIDPKEVGPLLRAIDGYVGYFVTKCALQLAPLLFVRPGELRFAEWTEFNFEDAMWTIPTEKMKGGQAHSVPLCRQAMEILTKLREATGASRYLFPSARTLSRNMSENSVNAALRRLGYEQGTMTGHGFRAMARTILDEVLQVKPELIEHQLAHAVRDPLGRAYNRTTHLKERREMMQRWADYLDGLKREVTVVPVKRQA